MEHKHERNSSLDWFPIAFKTVFTVENHILSFQKPLLFFVHSVTFHLPTALKNMTLKNYKKNNSEMYERFELRKHKSKKIPN